PQEEDDDAGEGTVGLVVAAEVGDVEPEADRGERGDDDGDDGTDADPLELGLLDVGGAVVEQRDDDDDDDEQDRPLGDAPHRDGGGAEADEVADGLGDGTADDEDDDRERDEEKQDESEEVGPGTQLPHRAALGDLVDAVHRLGETGDVVRGGPQRDEQTDDEADA